MDDKAIVLIIGAGGSVPFGFPTGEQLKWTIVDLLWRNGATQESTKRLSPLYRGLLEEGFGPEEIPHLIDRLKTSGWSSVDEFLAQHEDLQAVGKAAIAGVLLPCEKRDQLFDPKDKNGNRIDNWYQLLFKAIYSPFEEITRKKVNIFTYNYDTSLETYLKETMRSSYAHPQQKIDDALSHIPIVHLHGEFASHEYASESISVSLRGCSEKIKIVTDTLDNSLQFQQVTNALWKAEEIYFIGFGYDEKNLARLPIESKYPPSSPGARLGLVRPSLNLFGGAYQVGPGIIRRVKEYFLHKGFGIHLGDTGQDAYQFLRTTLLFGS
jgi:hypothetical protein